MKPGKTSLYLKPALAERIPEGASLPALIERGLDASPEPLPHSRLALEVRELVREDIRTELAGLPDQVRRAVRDEIQRAAGMG